LGQAVGVTVIFDEAVARMLYDHMSSRRKELRESGLFGPEVQVPQTANTQTKLLALLGRREDWVETTSV
jgi:hypothetical protein